VNGDALPGAILIYSEYKTTDAVIDSPSVLWNAVVGIWEATIPADAITQIGSASLHITATWMVPTDIDLVVSTLTANVVPVNITPSIHPLGNTRLHSFNIYGADGSVMNTCTNPVISYSVNGATQNTANWTISTYNNTMSRFSVSVVDPGWTHGDLIECNVMCDEGTGFFYLRVSDLSIHLKLLTMALGNDSGNITEEGTLTFEYPGYGTVVCTIGSDGSRTLESFTEG
jgi:hypothetical protein